MILTGRYILLLLPFFILTNHLSGAEESREEAIFGIVLNKYSSEFMVFIQYDSIYIPFEDVLSFFNIYYTVAENRRFQGYVNNSDSSFSIDFISKEIVDITGKKFKLQDNLWFATDLQIFVRTDLFEDIFKVQFRVMFNSLSIVLQSPYEMPFLRAMRTNQKLESFTSKRKQEYNFPLISSSSFTFLNGGVLDYTLGTSQTYNYQSYNFNSNLGLEVLNGEFQYNIYGRYFGDNFSYQDRVRWRYLVNSDWLQSISVGNVQNMSIRTSGSRGFRKPFYNLRGIQITNEEYKMPNVFTDYVIEDVIEPNWTVELYLADQLYDIRKADLNGYYRFDIPITYGLTNIKVKIYGTKGEFITEERVLNIPNQLLVPGELRYSFSAGEDDNTGIRLIEGTFNSGIFSWLTNSLTTIKEDNNSDAYLINQTAINLFNNTLLTFTATNRGIYEAGVKLPNNKLGNFEIYYTHYDQSYGNINQLSSINFIASLNRIGKLPISFSLFGSREEFNEWSTNNIYSTLSFFYQSLNFSIRHNLTSRDRAFKFESVYQNMSITTTYSLSRMPSLLEFLNRISLSASTYLNPSTLDIASLSFGAQFQLLKNLAVNSSYNYFTGNSSSSFRIGLNLNAQSLRSNSGIDINKGRDPIFTADISGSLEFDSRNLRFALINSTGSSSIHGKSSAAVRFFVDKNYNGVYDDDEALIPEADFILLDAMAKKTKLANYHVVTNLLPGTKYNIRIKPETLPNNSLIPVISEFAFIAKPYSYKSIDIACQPGGIIEGNIKRKFESGTKGQGGLRVYLFGIENKFTNNVLVFSDGSYFYDGIPPGKYIARVDSMQLAILKVKSVPEVIGFEVKATEFGDFVSDLNFVLFDSDSVDKWQKNRKDMIAKQVKKLKEYENRDFSGLTSGVIDDGSEEVTLAHSGEFIVEADYEYFLRGFNDDAPVNAGMIEGKIIYGRDIFDGQIADFNVYIEGVDVKHYSKAGVFADGSFFGNGLPPGKYRVYPAKYVLDKLKCKSEPEYREIEISNNPVGDVFFNVSFKLYR